MNIVRSAYKMKFCISDLFPYAEATFYYNYPFSCLSEIGMGLTGFGVFFLFFGMILFFDKALLAIGNVSDLHEINIYTEYKLGMLPSSIMYYVPNLPQQTEKVNFKEHLL